MRSYGHAERLSLEGLGWNERLSDAFGPFAGECRLPGRVVQEHTHLYRVLTERGQLLAHVSGRFRHQASGRQDFPAVGDWVVVRAGGHGRQATILAVLPRRSRFARKVAGSRTEEQVVAANVDTIFLVTGLDGDFNLRRIERYVVLARESGALPVVVLNKSDVCADVTARVREVERVALGLPVVAISAKSGAGLDAIRSYLRPGETLAFLGSSGVGKSTIVNALVGQPLIRTGEVRRRDSRGRHVSAARELVVLPDGGLVIDTPGMRELQLWDVTDGLSASFDDIEAFAGACRFRDCRHRDEPGCAVKAAVADGRLDNGRLDHYHRLQDELKRLTDQQEQKRRAKIMGRAIKAHPKTRRSS